ncbi:alpha/beta hydrolase family protein [Ceratobasidium sp. AG-Ba]|nr:alpha/beta hydrolase family protein [Ceratobasidium sp. AG-Ba]QRW10793.1 alpha/beta hydrolase family protein [Ceratobasidium sp. AG-Ba]
MPLLKLDNGVTLSYFSSPDARPSPSRPTILFLGALVQRADIQFEPQYRDALFAGFNCVGFDPHGHGDTTGRSKWDYKDNASDIVQGMKALGVEKFFVFGTSHGGMIAQEIGLGYPKATRGLILCGTTARRMGPEATAVFRDWLIPAWTATNPPPNDALMASMPSSFGAPATPIDQPGSAFGDRRPVGKASEERTTESAVGFELFCKIVDNLRTHCGEDKITKPVEALVAWPGSDTRLGGLKAPVLVIHGLDDSTFPVDHGEQIESLLPKGKHTRLVKLDGKGAHVINVIKEVVPQLNTTTREWLDEVIKDGF